MILEVGLIFITASVVGALLSASADDWGSAVAFVISAGLTLVAMILLMASIDAIYTNILGPVVLGAFGLIAALILAMWAVAAFITGLVVR